MTALSPNPSHHAELLAALERETQSAYLLSLGLSIIAVNDGWRRFARANGAPALAQGAEGQPLLEVVAEPLRSFYERSFARVRQEGKPWYHEYECSSPSVYRRLAMRVDLTAPGDAFVVVHSSLVEVPMAREAAPEARLDDYVNSRGVVIQCANCRRVRRRAPEELWDWLPWLVTTRPSNLSHGLCRTCATLYYSVAG